MVLAAFALFIVDNREAVVTAELVVLSVRVRHGDKQRNDSNKLTHSSRWRLHSSLQCIEHFFTLPACCFNLPYWHHSLGS